MSRWSFRTGHRPSPSPTWSRFQQTEFQHNGLPLAARRALYCWVLLLLATPVIAVYPGSFDPITLGHLDIIERAARIYDQVTVAVLTNPSKVPLFTVDERIQQIQRSTAHLANVTVDSFNGLTVDYVEARQAQVILRGLRAVSDFEMELQMAHTNKTLSDHIETVFLATSNEYSFLSSSVVKEVAKFGGPVDHLVPSPVASDLAQRYGPIAPSTAR